MVRSSTAPPAADGRADDAHPPRRFGPNIYWWLMVLLAATALVGMGSLIYLMFDERTLSLQFLIYFCLMAYVLIQAIEAWSVFTIHADGLEQRRLSSRRFIPWDELRRVGSRDIGVGGISQEHPAFWGDRGRFQEGSTDQSAFMFLVHDMDGAIVFRIPPWIRKRKELVREIQIRTRPRGRPAAPRSEKPGTPPVPGASTSPAGARVSPNPAGEGRSRKTQGRAAPHRRKIKDRTGKETNESGMKWVGLQVLLFAIGLLALLAGGDWTWNWVALVAFLACLAVWIYRIAQR